MGLLTRIARSADLANGMADRLDVDLTAQMTQSTLPAQDIRSIVMRCASCTGQADCAQLQAKATKLDAAPDYCRNLDIMHR